MQFLAQVLKESSPLYQERTVDVSPMLGYRPDTLFVVIFIVACHWSQVFVNFKNLPQTSIPCYLCHPRHRRLPPPRVVYASALSSMSMLVDSRLSRLKSGIFACSSRGSVFYLHTHSSCRIQLLITYRHHYLWSTSMPSPVQPVTSPVASAASSTSSAASNSLSVYSSPSRDPDPYLGVRPCRLHVSDTYIRLTSSPLGLVVPTDTHIYRRCLPCSCRHRLLSCLAVYACDKVSLLWNLLDYTLVLAPSSSGVSSPWVGRSQQNFIARVTSLCLPLLVFRHHEF